MLYLARFPLDISEDNIPIYDADGTVSLYVGNHRRMRHQRDWPYSPSQEITLPVHDMPRDITEKFIEFLHEQESHEMQLEIALLENEGAGLVLPSILYREVVEQVRLNTRYLPKELGNDPFILKLCVTDPKPLTKYNEMLHSIDKYVNDS